MMHPRRATLPRSVHTFLTIAVSAALFACARDSVTAPRQIAAGQPLFGKSPTALAVTSASPPFGDQGSTVNVHVFGSGFTAGAQATWLLHGVADAHVHTNSTTFISSSELVANITIASDAALDFWDVQVSLSSGKNGVGSECFEVTSAQILGPGTLAGDAAARTIDDQGRIVGSSTSNSSSIAWVYDDSFGMLSLGSGGTGGLDPLGGIVVGTNGNSMPVAWVQQPDNSWSTETLPLISGGIQGHAASANRLTDGTLVAVGSNYLAGPKKGSSSPQRPVWWRLEGGVWSSPVQFAIPAGVTTAAASDVDRFGEVVGSLDAPGAGILWQTPTSYILLDGTPGRINPSGTLIAGNRNSGPAYWWRDPATQQWHTTAVSLPTLAGSACTTGWARDVNDAGVIVGWSCNKDGNQQATAWQLDLSGATPVLTGTPTPLPGLGTKNPPGADVSVAAAVTSSAPYVATGYATSGNTHLAVRWLLR